MGHKAKNDSPKIYVACLAACNAGQLHGEWIFADQEPQEIQAAVHSMLEKSPAPFAEDCLRPQKCGVGYIDRIFSDTKFLKN